MQPNLNKKNPKRLKMILKTKYSETKKGLEGKLFDRLIVKEYSKQCGDNYYHKPTPIGINIEIRSKARLSLTQKEMGYIINLPNVSEVSKSICNSLVGVAYESVLQVSELFATKIHGNEDRIVVEIEML